MHIHVARGPVFMTNIFLIEVREQMEKVVNLFDSKAEKCYNLT